MSTLNSAQRKYLRGLAMRLKPSVHIGKKGLTETCLRELDVALTQNELIKVKFTGHKEEKKTLCAEIEAKTGSGLAGIVGNMAILYRQQPDAAKRYVNLPE